MYRKEITYQNVGWIHQTKIWIVWQTFYEHCKKPSGSVQNGKFC